VGTGDEAVTSHLRPETAQGIFADFKNLIDAHHPKLPFGVGQIGKAFRNEISPRDFIFRSREFEQMEVEYFIKEEEWGKHFESWKEIMNSFAREVGIDKVHELEVPQDERAHYSKRTIDFQFDYPFGRGELWGLAYRTDFDLKNHSLDYFDEEAGKRFVPHVVEPTFGMDRTFLTVLFDAYSQDTQKDKSRIFLKIKPSLAPYKVAVFPLLANKPDLMVKAKKINEGLSATFATVFDKRGNIGKRYFAQDEIGTPFCVTVDFDTLENDAVTVRDRNTTKQETVSVDKLAGYLQNKIE